MMEEQMSDAERLRKLVRLVNKIEELAYDGQNGSAAYAFDRLAQIRRTTEPVMKRIGQWP